MPTRASRASTISPARGRAAGCLGNFVGGWLRPHLPHAGAGSAAAASYPPDTVRPRFGTDAPPRGALLVISTEHPAPMIAASRHLYINSFVRESF